MWKGFIRQVHWEPTDKCNSACPMCPRYTHDGFESKFLANAEWTLESFKKSWPVDFIKELDKILACGNFGDPCACREFVDIYEYLREINPNIELACNTNGSLRNTDWWYRLGKVIGRNRSDYCTFSLDGLEDTNHLYRRNTNWKKIIENVKAFIDGGGTAHWDYIVFEHNEHQVDEAKQLAKSLGFKNFNIKKTTRWRNYKNNQGSYPVFFKGKYLYDLKQAVSEKYKHNFEDTILFQDQKNQSFKSEDIYNMQGHIHFDRRWVNGGWKDINLNKLSIACRAVSGAREYHKNEIFISASGHVAPCCFLGSEPFIDPKDPRMDKNYVKMIELQGGMDSVNIHKNNLHDILNLDIFQKWIPNTWDNENGNSSMRPLKCGQCCGVEFNALDYGELGDKKGSNIE